MHAHQRHMHNRLSISAPGKGPPLLLWWLAWMHQRRLDPASERMMGSNWGAQRTTLNEMQAGQPVAPGVHSSCATRVGFYMRRRHCCPARAAAGCGQMEGCEHVSVWPRMHGD